MKNLLFSRGWWLYVGVAAVAAVPLLWPALSATAMPPAPARVPAPIAAGQSSDQPTGIIVNGEATVLAEPDVAYVTVGVQTEGATAQDAQGRNNEIMQRVLDAVKAAGIAENEIKTTGLSLYPTTNNQGQTTGYRATNGVRVTVNQIQRAGPVLDAAIGAGANTAGNIQFTIKDQSRYYGQALAEAVTQSRAKAEAIAGAMGASIVGVQSVEEMSSAVPVQRQAAPVPAPMAAAAAPPTPVQPGEQQITGRVRVTYLFR